MQMKDGGARSKYYQLLKPNKKYSAADGGNATTIRKPKKKFKLYGKKKK